MSQRKLPDLWTGRLGQWRVQLVVRAFGGMLGLFVLGRMHTRSLVGFLNDYPPAVVFLAFSGLLLLVFGARLITLVLAALAGGHLLLVVLNGEGGRGLTQQAAEYPMFAVLPLFLGLAALLARVRETERRRWERTTDQLLVLVLRWSVLVTLFWVSFHKWNEDFFNPQMSCATLLQSYARNNWSGEWLALCAGKATPAAVVLVEGPVLIVLLVLLPRLGVMALTGVFLAVSLSNAIVVTLSVIVPSLAFLPASDGTVLRRNLWKLTAIWMAAVTVVLIISSSHYTGTRPWIQYALHQGFCTWVMVVCVVLQVSACRRVWRGLRREWVVKPALQVSQRPGKWAGMQSRPPSRPWRWLRYLTGLESRGLIGQDWRGRVVVGLVAGMWILNGLSPYLGWKFNYSYAMLSNLRVDDARWNHLVMPRWIRLTEHDGLIHVRRVESTFPSDSARKRYESGRSRETKPLRAAVFSPNTLHDRLDALRKLPGPIGLEIALEWRGEAMEFWGVVGDEAFERFVNSLPRRGPWWRQDELPASGQQPCKH